MSKPLMASTRTFKTTTEVESANAKKEPKRKPISLKKKNLPWYIIGLLVIFSIFLYFQYQDAKNKLDGGSQAVINRQVTSTISSVEKLLIFLPKSETPTVATITNVQVLQKSSTFFNNAENGDKLLVYAKAKVAVIYRPSTNQIVNFSEGVSINGQ